MANSNSRSISESPSGTELHRRYILGVLTLVYTFNSLDRCVLSLLLEPIKRDLRLSDTQLGFLSGIAFGLFYAALGIPIARWADRGDRAKITAAALALWGATVMLCLLVTNFAQLVVARIAAAVGEAGCMPPSYSLLGDYFPRADERTRAMAIWSLGVPLSPLIGLTMGGWLNELYGWRMTFCLMGIPALLIAILVRLTIRDPRLELRGGGSARAPLPSMPRTLSRLWRQRSSRHLCAGLILLFTVGQGLNPWYAVFMIRAHGMGTAALGIWLGLLFGLGGIAGIVLGGYTAGRWFVDDEAGQARLNAVMIASLVPGYIVFLTVRHPIQALVALIPLALAFNFILGPTFAVMQRLVQNDARATMLAVVMLLANLIGMGVGPQAVGLVSDLLAPSWGDASLRYAMLGLSLLSFWSSYHFWQVGRTVKVDLEDIAERTQCDLGLERAGCDGGAA